jgi:hypothetical protein
MLDKQNKRKKRGINLNINLKIILKKINMERGII